MADAYLYLRIFVCLYLRPINKLTGVLIANNRNDWTKKSFEEDAIGWFMGPFRHAFQIYLVDKQFCASNSYRDQFNHVDRGTHVLWILVTHKFRYSMHLHHCFDNFIWIWCIDPLVLHSASFFFFPAKFFSHLSQQILINAFLTIYRKFWSAFSFSPTWRSAFESTITNDRRSGFVCPFVDQITKQQF